MAKAGEGDPRWLVQNRQDGQNVNNWHWTEADLTPWAKEALTSRLSDLALVDDETAQVTVSKAEKFEGEVTVSTRKGRTIFFYDLSIELKWKGSLKDGSLDNVEGAIHVGDIEQDSDVDDFDFRLSVKGAETPAHKVLKELVRTAGKKAIGVVVAQFNADLRERAGSAMGGSGGGGGGDSRSSSTSGKKKTLDVERLAEAVSKDAAAVPSSGAAEPVETVTTKTGGSLKTTRFSQTLKFRCRPRDLIECFADAARVRAFTRDSNAVVGAAAGAAFAHYDGMLSGSVESLGEEGMVWLWRMRAWPAEHHARIEMKMSFGNDCTTVELTATRVPAGQKDDTMRALDHFYWSRIKSVFGYSH
eukprot:TRINITY_DN233_c0_g2_i1.p1 TRINITY_DN233_c0_g2~~TRINITY_DN233_c0_g2_i1.p1  ORF type:complete len:382 (-),score=215.41 TRINITY_DN233_c0_g2_i1:26-1102(-)